MQKICEELAKMSHEVHVITSTLGAKDRPKYEEINNVHIHRVRAWTLHYPDLTIPREIPRDLLKKADIVHGWSQNSLFTYRVCREAKKLGKPIVMYFLGVDYLKNHYNPLIRIFGYSYQKLITRKVVKITDLALVTNEYEKELLRKKYEIDAIVLPHGVNEMYLKLPNMAHEFREKYNIKGKIIAYIGRIHPTKGLDMLIKAFAEVAKQVPDATLVIVGKGDQKYLRKCLKLAEKLGVRDMVKYLGYISEEDKIALIDASEVVVLPTRHAGESYPLTIDEILARGKVAIVIGASKMLLHRVEKIKTNIIVSREKNAASLAGTIVNTLKRKVLQSLDTRFQLLTWGDVAEKLKGIYDKLLIRS